MAQKLTNVYTFLGILFLFAILVISLMYLGKELVDNDNANLDNDSITYIAGLVGVDDANLDTALSRYTTSTDDQEESILVSDNTSQGNPKDYALDFLFAKEKGFSIEITIKRIFSIPSFIIVDLLRFNLNDFSWLINIFGWFIGIVILIAIVYWARGVIT